MKRALQQRRFDFFKEAYDRELTRRSEATDRLSGVITAYTVVGGFAAYLATNLPQQFTTWWAIAFAVPLGIGLVLWGIGLWWLVVAIQRSVRYKTLATPQQFDDAITDAVAKVPDTEENDRRCVVSFDAELLTQYRDFASVNQLANNRRDRRFGAILGLAALASACLVVSSIPYIIVSRQEGKEPTAVVIKSPIKVMKDDPTPQSSQSQPPAPQAQELQPSAQATDAIEPAIVFHLPPPISIANADPRDTKAFPAGDDD